MRLNLKLTKIIQPDNLKLLLSILFKIKTRRNTVRITTPSDYNKRVIDEIVKPVKQAAEKAFKKHGLKKPRIIVFVPKSETKPKINVKKVAEGLGAEIITDPAEIAKMKKKSRPWRPK
ncbi:MAG: hypothetical protein UU14_C0055G0002 [Candidatus Roizmanbacteria bacterium GW2011_GWB1_40_7]|uniref:Uncharacterized protein n=1 Tax=Candidatus Roizmanbacteria bacterium GW2011_GWB1_40_7 TaxID=1618482 RepID=A0A0G0VDV0_9BACT|nr:MAG: hypothetical protein UU14_C0055G0002 [Candidatus Roizmanbacteria bacterium GW2011_GWB1_40_7]